MLSRKCKHRNCRKLDGNVHLKPLGIPAKKLEQVQLFIDEFEAIRLCDYDGLSQIEAGEKMGISRTTVQRLLISSRKKIVDVILHKKALLVENNKYDSRS